MVAGDSSSSRTASSGRQLVMLRPTVEIDRAASAVAAAVAAAAAAVCHADIISRLMAVFGLYAGGVGL